MDCSSMTIIAARQAGYPTGGAWYTGDMVPTFISAGWECLDYSWDAMQPGDVVIRPANAWRGGHVVVIGYQGTCYEAYTDEIAPEDQVRQTSIYEFGADYILRPPADDYTAPAPEPEPEPEPTITPNEGLLMFVRVNFGDSYGYALIPFGLGASGISQEQADRYYRAGLRPVEVSGEDFTALVNESWAHYGACFGTLASKSDVQAQTDAVINAVKAAATKTD
nr:MAG TPA: L-endopeptidase [Caudoviricetes sp.]